MSVVLLGGSGLLGTQLRQLRPDILAPTHEEVDICQLEQVERYLSKIKPDVVIHAAALTDSRIAEREPALTVKTNIIGTANIALVCMEQHIRLVYISTDYIYKGERGNYRESDEILPFNKYAWSKLGGEAAVVQVENHLIIRTSFGLRKFPYPKAFADKWFSKDYVDVIAPMILDASFSPLTGVLNIGTERKTVYDYAVKYNPDVAAISIGNAAFSTPFDTSLNLQRWLAHKSSAPVARIRSQCRICGSPALAKYLDLGLMPLANNLGFSAQDARTRERFPLQVAYCAECGQSQLSVVIDPEIMYNYYTYRSSISQTFIAHCRAMAQSLGPRLLLKRGDLVLDIAGNDGTLLAEFKDELGIQPLNIDPAGNIAAVSMQRGIPVINEFWSNTVAEQVLREHGPARLVTATNIIAHVDNIEGFMEAVRRVLHPQGRFVAEFPYLVDFIQHHEYDTVYFEHLSYFLVGPLVRLARDHGMTVCSVSHVNIHGGSLRVEFAPGNVAPDTTVDEFQQREQTNGFRRIETYQRWSADVARLICDTRTALMQIKREGARIAAFGASAKGNTLLNACRMSTDIIDYIIDDTPEKIGRYSPGNGIPIVNRSMLNREPPDYLLILAWNFKDEIIRSLPGYHGKYLIPIPKFSIADIVT